MHHNPRFDLATARVALRAAEDAEETAKAVALLGVQGPNETARKQAGILALAQSDAYQSALSELRAAQASVDHAQAAVDIANDDLRRAELAARERLAEALAGKRADEAVFDYAAALEAPYDR